MPSNATSRSRLATITRTAAPLLGISLVVAILYRFPPEQYSFYPRCPIHETFGLLCPGCGATRALAALLHGNLREAMRLNAWFVLISPVIGGYAVACYIKLITRKPLPSPQPMTMYVASIIALIFGVLRNTNLL